MDSRNKKLGEFVRQQRKKLGLTQEQLAERLAEHGFTYTDGTIAFWETGRYAIPIAATKDDKNFLDAIAEVLKIPALKILEVGGYVTQDDLYLGLPSEAVEVAKLLGALDPQDMPTVKRILTAMIHTPA